MEVLHIFRWVFPFFQNKNVNIKISEEIESIWEKFSRLNWFLLKGSIRIRLLKFWFARSGSGKKWTGSATLQNAQLLVIHIYPFLFLDALFLFLSLLLLLPPLFLQSSVLLETKYLHISRNLRPRGIPTKTRPKSLNNKGVFLWKIRKCCKSNLGEMQPSSNVLKIEFRAPGYGLERWGKLKPVT